MSQSSEQTRLAGGKTPRERRRLSSDQPYKRPRTSTSTPDMPATRRSPARPPPESVDTDEQLPLASIMQELALLRKAMDARFSDAEKKADSLRGELVGKLDANDKAVSDLQMAVTDVTLSVDDNQRAIHEVRAEVERREIELPGKVKAIVQEVLDRSRAGAAGPRPRTLRSHQSEERPDRSERQEEAYDLARRSLRVWPVSREGDLLTRTREFFVAELLIDKKHVLDLKMTVKRAPGPNRARERDSTKIRDEVVVVFETARERDEVRSFAKNLEKKGRGLRLEVPDHLWPSFRVLQELGYELRQKNASLRRNVLFDDSARDLKMDFSDDSQVWRTVSPADARKSLAKCRPSRGRRGSVSAAELEQLLGQEADSDMSVNDEF